MWGTAVLFLISFALILFSRIAKKRETGLVFGFLGIAVWGVAAFLAPKNDEAFFAIMGILNASLAFSDLIAIPILRKRVMPPCVRAKKASQSGNIAAIIVSFLFLAFVIFVLVTGGLSGLGWMIFLGLSTVSLIIYLLLLLFDKIEIWGNGLWQCGKFQPWEEYKSFSWKWKTKDSIELGLVLKSEIWPAIRLVVRSEDREAVHQLLEANLPDLSK
jgi:hypothetical protein